MLLPAEDVDLHGTAASRECACVTQIAASYEKLRGSSSYRKRDCAGVPLGAFALLYPEKETLLASTRTLHKRDWQASSDRLQIVTACVFKLSAVPRQVLAAAACRA